MRLSLKTHLMKRSVGLLGLFLLIVILLGTFFLKKEKDTKDPYKALYYNKMQPRLFAKDFSDHAAAPQLSIKNDREKSVPMKALKVSVFIEHNIARTRYEMIFSNPHNRQLEGELQFPLKDGQAISYFALEVNGEMRPGVAVERTQARVAYQATVRKGVDPGLVEKIQGNLFRLRIFPVPAKGQKRVIIETQELLLADPTHAYYRLAPHFTQQLSSFDLKLQVYGLNRAPKILKSFDNKHSLRKLDNHSYTYRCTQTKTIPKGEFLLEIPTPAPSTIVASSSTKQQFFMADLAVPLRYAVKKKPQKITICWDQSLSRNRAQIAKELRMLERYLRYLNKVDVELIGFAHRVLYRKDFKIKNGSAKTLKSYLKAQVYDGATVISALPFEQFKGEEILLFTDGIQTIGQQKKLACKKPLYVIHSAPQSDLGFMSSLTRSNHGTVLNLAQLTLGQAFFALRTVPLQFMGFKEKASIMNQCSMEASQHFGRLQVFGELPLTKKHLTAQFGLGEQIIHQERISIKTSPAKSNIYEKMWAIAYLNELQQQPKLHKASILKLGLQYRLLTNETSLLVLDDINDYVEHGIVPPKTLQKKYKILRAKYLKEKKDEHAEHWKALKSDWKEYLKWYANPNYEIKRPTYPLDEGVVIGVQEEYGNAATLSEVPAAVSTETEEAPVSQERRSSANEDGFASGAQTFTWTNENNFTISPSGSSTGSFDIAATGLSPSSISSYSLSMSNGNATAAQGQNAGQSTLKLAAWNPKTPYLKQLKRVPASKIYETYLLLRPTYQDQPSFYIDVSDFFMKKKQYPNAVRVLSNLAEMQIQDPSLLRLLAQRLLQMKENKLALVLFEQIIELRPEEPQSYRDLGLALEAVGQFQKAIEQLYKVVKNPYDHRFEGIHMIVLNEINHIVNRHPKGLDLKFIDPIFLKKLPYDVRVVLNWDADDTDVDLWVTEPGGEKCMYSYQRTENGGRISNDFTQGYGPEEYLIKKAPNGSFHIQAHYYGNHRPSLNGKAQLTVQFYLHYGTPFEIKREVTRRLQTVDEEIDLATFEFDN